MVIMYMQIYDTLKDVHVVGEFENPDTSINAVSMEQSDEDYIRPNANLESRLKQRMQTLTG